MPRKFTEAERHDFLAAKHVAVLSVATDDGRPPAKCADLVRLHTRGNIRINTGAGNRKARLIERAGAITLTVQHEEPPYQYVVVEGTVVDTERPASAGPREEIAIRYLGEEAGREFARSYDNTDTVLFTIKPDRWFTADFSGEL